MSQTLAKPATLAEEPSPIPGISRNVSLARERARAAPSPDGHWRLEFSGATPAYWFVLGVSLLFAFGNSSDAFLLLRAQDLGLGLSGVILAYAPYNATYALLSYPAGIVADRIGPRAVLSGGFLDQAGQAAPFALGAVTGLAAALLLASNMALTRPPLEAAP